MKVYKLTNDLQQSYNKTQWGENVSHESSGLGPLCSSGWLHAYLDPHLAVVLNPIHAACPNPILWNAEGEGKVKYDHQLKVGFTKLTTLKQIILPEVTIIQKTCFGILCARKVFQEKKWNDWADKWLSSEDRSKESASSTYAITSAHAYTSGAFTSAAYAAAYTVYTSGDFSSNWPAYAAAHASSYAASNEITFDLIEIMKEALEYASN